ncbi:MAG: DUF5671 domain-containing protein [Anaerolineales bacterium]
MRTVRRLYFYTVAFVSSEIVLWGITNLIRAALDTGRVGGSTSQLAGALSLILVGLPVFLLHWHFIQRSAARSAEERFAGVRAVFLYAILSALTLPIIQNVLALADRVLLLVFSLDPRDALIGGGQTWVDNLIAILINGLLAAYFYPVLRKDWGAAATQPGEGDTPSEPTSPENLTLARRVFRYLGAVYGLGLALFGVQQVLQYSLNLLGLPGVQTAHILAEGLAFILVGTPVWAGAWRWVQNSLTEPAERRSLFRLVVLYVLVFTGVGGVLIPAGEVIYQGLRALLGESVRLAEFISEIASPLAVVIPFGGVWAYYGRILDAEMDALPGTPRRGGLRRLYFYLLALTGLGAAFSGIQLTLTLVVDAALGEAALTETAASSQLAGALATLAVGLPLWLRAWLPMIAEAAGEDEAGDHARRSVVRKAYLYLALFVGVVGVMSSARTLFFEIFSIWLGDSSDSPLLLIVQQVKDLLLFGGMLAYHWQALRVDGRRAEQSLTQKHASFPVLVLDPGEGAFANAMFNALQRRVPAVPVAVHRASDGAPSETLTEAQAVILPSELATNSSEALRLWLSTFPGQRLVVPIPTEGWLWLEASGKPLEKLGDQVAQAVRQLAEGEEARLSGRPATWLIVLAVVGGALGLLLSIMLVGTIISEL